MATNDVGPQPNQNLQDEMDKEYKVKIICLGDSAVGKSK